MAVQVPHATAAKPKIGGGVARAPIGTELPTDAKATLNEAFKSLGYVTEEGLINGNTRESQDIKAWGGDVVLTTQTDKQDTFKFTLLGAIDTEVLKVIHGDTNVTGTIDTGVTVNVNAKELEYSSWAFDMVLANGVLKRIVVPQASIAEIGETTYVDGDAVSYPITLKALPDAKGNTHYEYIVKGGV